MHRLVYYPPREHRRNGDRWSSHQKLETVQILRLTSSSGRSALPAYINERFATSVRSSAWGVAYKYGRDHPLVLPLLHAVA